MRAYVSGGMTGWPDNNQEAFDEAEEYLRSIGWDPTTPVELGRQDGEVLEGDGFNASDDEYEGFLARDLELVSAENFDAVVFIRGWRTSGGAGREGRRAIEQGLKLYELRTGWTRPYLIPILPEYFLHHSRTERLRPGEHRHE